MVPIYLIAFFLVISNVLFLKVPLFPFIATLKATQNKQNFILRKFKIKSDLRY